MSDRTFKDAFNMICGEKLGSGIHRDVFECKFRDDLVVKVEHDHEYRSFANVREWLNWDDLQFVKSVALWLAPIEYVSPDGFILLQKRVAPVRPSDLPEKLPAFLTDIKPENFGIYEGRLVCVDYSTTIKNVSTRLKRVDWT